MGSGKKAPQAQYKPLKSTFDGFKGSSFDLGGFGTSGTTYKDGQLSTTGALGGGLQTGFDNAQLGLGQNQGYLAQDPSQQFAALDAGSNPYYNNLREQLNRNWITDSGTQQLGFSQNGMENSTARGGFLGQLASDYTMRDAAARMQGMTAMNQQARDNSQSNLAALQGLYGFIAPTAGLTSNNAMDALGSIDQVSMADKNYETQVALANLQSQNDAKARRSGLLGNIIGGVATVAGAALKATSDRRLKKNISLLGKLKQGLNLYSYSYLWESDKETHLGVMADEVERVLPSAVLIMKSGYKAVDYSQVLAALEEAA